MTPLLLVEELFLLTHDAETGRAGASLDPDAGLAGALLLDLAAAGLITVEAGALQPVPGTPGHPLLAEAYAAIGASDTPRTASDWVTRLPAQLRPLATKVGQSLVDRGVLAERPRRMLGLFPTTSWPQVDPGPERALRARVLAVLVDGAEPDAGTALLVAVLSAVGLIQALVPRKQRTIAARRATALVDAGADTDTDTAGNVVTSAVARSLTATQAAIMAATVVPAITAATIS